MKKIILLTILTTTFMQLQAQEKTVTVPSVISNVTIFLRGAEIQREGSIALQTGAQQLVFDNLPQDINPQSIQVSGVGNFTILGVSHRINYLKPAEKSKEIIDLEKSLKSLDDKISLLQATLDDLASETLMLKANQSIGGEQSGVKISELKEFADFFRTRLNDLTTRRMETNVKIFAALEEKNAITKQLRTLQSNPQKQTGAIVVDITASAAGQAKVTVNYLVYSAGWTPSYDLRVSDINSPIELIYKANVYQSTNEEWKDVKPVFSTANPTLNNAKPELHPWYLSFYNPAPISAYQSFNAMESVDAKKIAERREMDADDLHEINESPAASSIVSSTLQENQTSIEFTINIPYTIQGNGQSHAVELAKYDLPAVYEYYAIRKLEKDVFLLAKVTGWEKLNLLSGNANIFFEGKYVGESHIETRKTDDIMSLSLGRDKNITVTRIRKKDYNEKQFLSNNVTETREWDLTVHNKKKQPITITVEDQVPVSTEKEIKVEILNVSDAEKNIDTGKLLWKFTLKPSESRSMNVKYSVKYPKSKTVVLE